MKLFKISILVLLTMGSIGPSWANSEKDRIRFLLETVESSQCTFIRNGSHHKASKARKHLERKLNHAGDRIKTAEDFINHLASKSSFSGRPYFIQEKNGTKVAARVWFYRHLALFDKGRLKAKRRKK